jgi:hypothetical protein
MSDRAAYNPSISSLPLSHLEYDLRPNIIMTSILVSATQAAHSAAALLLSKAQIAPGGTIPSGLKVKENQVLRDFSPQPTNLINKSG